VDSCLSAVSLDDKPDLVEIYKETIGNLKTLVDHATENIKKELLSQIKLIESGLKAGELSKEQFESEANEIKSRLLKFIKRG
jgi:hypothetical protein